MAQAFLLTSHDINMLQVKKEIKKIARVLKMCEFPTFYDITCPFNIHEQETIMRFTLT